MLKNGAFFDTEKYVLHYESLQLCLKLKKGHHVLEFSQSRWLKPYVEMNTHKKDRVRKYGDSDGKSTFLHLYILMNNVVYGKTIENVRNRMDVRLVSHEKDYLK